MILDTQKLKITGIQSTEIVQDMSLDHLKVHVDIDGFAKIISVNGSRAQRIFGILRSEIIDQLNSKPE